MLTVFTGRLYFIKIWRLRFLINFFENMLLRKSSQNVSKNKLCLIITNLLGQVG